MPALLIERLAEAEEELAAACSLAAARVPEAEEPLAELEARHVEAAAELRVQAARRGQDPRSAARRLQTAWARAWSRLRVGTATWATASGALEWLRDRELRLARRYAALLSAENLDVEVRERVRASVAAAWQRTIAVERLVALQEFGELASA